MSGSPFRSWLTRLTPFAEAQTSRDPLAFPGYRERLDAVAALTGNTESVTCGVAECERIPVVAVLFNFAFLGGSMGEATGRRIVEAIDRAAELHLPLFTVAASGGARMQEGMLSLIQMQAISGALNRLREQGLPHLAVACHPTTGGVWASLVSAADVILAEAGAEVAFSGFRVRDAQPEAAEFRAEGKFVAGAVDAVLPLSSLPNVAAGYLRALTIAMDTPPHRCPAPYPPREPVTNGPGWQAVQAARDPDRPGADEYLQAYFDERFPISGDRVGGHDPSMTCGIGLRHGQAIAYAAQRGGANTPAGFRTAGRLIDLAQTLSIPVLTLIDTPGAQASAEAERGNIGTAIGELMRSTARATVPITSLLIGEGGSGGALSLASSGCLWAASSGYFSVLAPERAAALLYRDSRRAPEAANVQRVDPQTLVELGIARGIVEPSPTVQGLDRDLVAQPEAPSIVAPDQPPVRPVPRLG